jgi:hypothetical protein
VSLRKFSWNSELTEFHENSKHGLYGQTDNWMDVVSTYGVSFISVRTQIIIIIIIIIQSSQERNFFNINERTFPATQFCYGKKLVLSEARQFFSFQKSQSNGGTQIRKYGCKSDLHKATNRGVIDSSQRRVAARVSRLHSVNHSTQRASCRRILLNDQRHF